MDSLLQPRTRREFLRQSTSGIGLIAFSQVAPSFLTQSVQAQAPRPEKDRRILVLVQLAGGNDGLNTLIPYEDDLYYRMRPQLALSKRESLPLDDQFAFHPQCGPLAELYREGHLGIIQNVGYPNPNRSHFRSMEIWETAAASNEFKSDGWIGRYFDNACEGEPGSSPVGISIGNELPDTFLARKDHNVFGLSSSWRKGGRSRQGLVDVLQDYDPHPQASNAHYIQHTLMNSWVTERKVLAQLQAYSPEVEYPGNAFARSLRNVAGLIAAGNATRVYFVSLGGFDTHVGQKNRHSNLMTQFSAGMAAFQRDLFAQGLQDQVLTMTFSEFGRRPHENASGGTDHGTASPLFVMGSSVTGGWMGSPPDLDLERGQDITFSTDFRQVYSTLLKDWLETDPGKVLDESYPSLPFLKA
jgi:uncharacterized protein (DUF1501 family)